MFIPSGFCQLQERNLSTHLQEEVLMSLFPLITFLSCSFGLHMHQTQGKGSKCWNDYLVVSEKCDIRQIHHVFVFHIFTWRPNDPFLLKPNWALFWMWYPYRTKWKETGLQNFRGRLSGLDSKLYPLLVAWLDSSFKLFYVQFPHLTCEIAGVIRNQVKLIWRLKI